MPRMRKSKLDATRAQIWFIYSGFCFSPLLRNGAGSCSILLTHFYSGEGAFCAKLKQTLLSDRWNHFNQLHFIQCTQVSWNAEPRKTNQFRSGKLFQFSPIPAMISVAEILAPGRNAFPKCDYITRSAEIGFHCRHRFYGNDFPSPFHSLYPSELCFPSLFRILLMILSWMPLLIRIALRNDSLLGTLSILLLW